MAFRPSPGASKRWKKLPEHMRRERARCSRHRCTYPAWQLIDGRPVVGRCFRCDEDVAAAKERAAAKEPPHE